MHVRVERTEGGRDIMGAIEEWVMLEAVVRDDEWNRIPVERCTFRWLLNGDILEPNMETPNQYRVDKHTGRQGRYVCEVDVRE